MSRGRLLAVAHAVILLAVLASNVRTFLRLQDPGLPVPAREAVFRPLDSRPSLELAAVAGDHPHPWVRMGFAAYYGIQERFVGRDVVARGLPPETVWPWRHLALVRVRDDGGPRPQGDVRLGDEQASRLRARARARVRLGPVSDTVEEAAVLFILVDPNARSSATLHLLEDRSGTQYLVAGSQLPPQWRAR